MSARSPEDRLDQLGRAVDNYPARVADLRDIFAEVAAQIVTGTAAGGQVAVTATGDGVVDSVRISPRALRQLDNRALAKHVMNAVNEALEEGAALFEEAIRRDPEDEVLDAAEEAEFAAHMRELHERLDAISRSIDKFTDRERPTD
jgi:DNA-binding protein YbaB